METREEIEDKIRTLEEQEGSPYRDLQIMGLRALLEKFSRRGG